MVSLSSSHDKVLLVAIVNAHAEPVVFYDNSRHLIDRFVQGYAYVDARGASIPSVGNQLNNRRDRA